MNRGDAMNTYLRELYLHQEWADAEHWLAFDTYPAALEDQRIRERLHHIHLVQAAFLWAVEGQTRKFAITKVEDYSNPADLKAFARKYHSEMSSMLGDLEEGSLAKTIEVRGFSRR